MTLRCLAALTAVMLLGCGGDEKVTEILVVVDSDVSGLREVVVAVEGLEGPMTASAPLGKGREPLPRVLGVVHEGGPLGPTTIAAFGVAANDTVVISQHFEVSFVEGETMRLDMMLSQKCLVVQGSCEKGTTCIDGVCEPDDEAELQAWTGSP